VVVTCPGLHLGVLGDDMLFIASGFLFAGHQIKVWVKGPVELPLNMGALSGPGTQRQFTEGSEGLKVAGGG
jgi:hypothetical protein